MAEESIVGEDFTIEFFYYIRALPTNTCGLFQTKYGNNVGFELRLYSSGSVRLEFRNTPSANYVKATPAMPVRAWHHMAVTRQGNIGSLWSNGELVSSFDVSTMNWQAMVLELGMAGSAALFDGYLDDVRVTKGVARYTQNFEVPTEAF